MDNVPDADQVGMIQFLDDLEFSGEELDDEIIRCPALVDNLKKKKLIQLLNFYRIY